MINLLEKNKFLSLILTILIIIEIFYFSSLSGVTGPETEWPLIPIIYHFIVFFLLSFFIFATIKGDKKIKPSLLIFVLIISIIFSFLDEIHQIFVLFRDASFGDILTDCLGIFTSMIIYLYINKKREKIKQVF